MQLKYEDPKSPVRSQKERDPATDPQVTEDADRLHSALSEIIRVAQFRDRDRVCCYDVSVSQCYAMEAVVERGAATVNEVASELYLDKSTASRLVDALVRKGYVRKAANAEDARSVLLQATARGRRLVERVRGDIAQEYVDVLSELDAEGRASAIRVVGQLARAFASRVDASGGTCCVIR